MGPAPAELATGVLVGAIDTVLGRACWQPPTNWGVVLVTFPDRTGSVWTVPTAGWHYDFDLHANATSTTGLQVFTFLSAVGPRGGGTLIVEGSHRLLRRFGASLSPDERRGDHQELRRRFLRHDPWLAGLTGARTGSTDRVDYFMRDGHESGGVPLRATELTGEPGDVVLCHPLMRHVAAPNAAATPRFMRSQRICRAGPPGGA